jgi:hypothetical protein
MPNMQNLDNKQGAVQNASKDKKLFMNLYNTENQLKIN